MGMTNFRAEDMPDATDTDTKAKQETVDTEPVDVVETEEAPVVETVETEEAPVVEKKAPVKRTPAKKAETK